MTRVERDFDSGKAASVVSSVVLLFGTASCGSSWRPFCAFCGCSVVMGLKGLSDSLFNTSCSLLGTLTVSNSHASVVSKSLSLCKHVTPGMVAIKQTYDTRVIIYFPTLFYSKIFILYLYLHLPITWKHIHNVYIAHWSFVVPLSS